MSGEAWLKERNNNAISTPPHKIANAKCNVNLIGRMGENEDWVIEESKIATKIVLYFKLPFSKLVGGWRCKAVFEAVMNFING